MKTDYVPSLNVRTAATAQVIREALQRNVEVRAMRTRGAALTPKVLARIAEIAAEAVEENRP